MSALHGNARLGQATGWFLGLALITVLPLNGQAHCSISASETKACVQTSLLIAIHCQNESKATEEWLDVGDSRGVWELIHPYGQVEKSQGSRYTTAPSLIRLAPGEESTIITPVTRWFALSSAGTYRLRLRVDISGSAPLQTNEISFGVTPCGDADVLAACREAPPGKLKAVGLYRRPGSYRRFQSCRSGSLYGRGSCPKLNQVCEHFRWIGKNPDSRGDQHLDP